MAGLDAGSWDTPSRGRLFASTKGTSTDIELDISIELLVF
jgi:hypothetical protein